MLKGRLIINPRHWTVKKKYCQISEDEIEICEKTAGLPSQNFSNLNSACSKVLVPEKIYFSTQTCEMKVNDIRTQKTVYYF